MPTKFEVIPYNGKKYSIQSLCKKLKINHRTYKRHIENGYTVDDIAELGSLGLLDRRKTQGGIVNLTEMRCRVCGMEFSINKHQTARKRTCSSRCTYMEKKYPDEFGLWWKE